MTVALVSQVKYPKQNLVSTKPLHRAQTEKVLSLPQRFSNNQLAVYASNQQKISRTHAHFLPLAQRKCIQNLAPRATARAKDGNFYLLAKIQPE